MTVIPAKAGIHPPAGLPCLVIVGAGLKPALPPFALSPSKGSARQSQDAQEGL